MTTLLKVQTSLFGDKGQSSKLMDGFVRNWLESNPHGRVVERDLAADPVPHLTAERFQALLTKPEARTPEQQAIVDESDRLIEELRSADVILLGVPMYNFSVPSTLRAYFDHVARAGVTFRYTEAGPEGLIRGKKVYLFVTRGGVYGEGEESQIPYVRQFLAFIGISELEVIRAEGLAMGDGARERGIEAAVSAAREAVGRLVPAAAVAA
jgi:FMN-dependent NADH-azoreductase